MKGKHEHDHKGKSDVHNHEHTGKHGAHDHKHPGHEKELHKHKDTKKK